MRSRMMVRCMVEKRDVERVAVSQTRLRLRGQRALSPSPHHLTNGELHPLIRCTLQVEEAQQVCFGYRSSPTSYSQPMRYPRTAPINATPIGLVQSSNRDPNQEVGSSENECSLGADNHCRFCEGFTLLRRGRETVRRESIHVWPTSTLRYL
jgi:hypothetical protein